MENFNKKDLLFTIDKQTDEISRYKSRLRDVITAFKGLQSEKEAIEASFKAITLSKSSPKSSNSRDKNNGIAALDECDNSLDLETTGEPKQHSETTDDLKTQLSTLMNSLATLSAEKSRMEASFQADKKQLRSEKEEREKKIKDLQERLQNMTKQRQTDVETIKSRLIVERHEREKEQTDHAIMLRELQKLLAEDRRAKERLDAQADELRTALAAAREGRPPAQAEQHELAVRGLRNELEAARGKLARAQAEASQTPAVLAGMQTELCLLRDQHQVALAQERARAARAEDQARRLAANHEDRVAGLEARLAELSDTVGSYDRLRQQDQVSIDKLKQRIAQLDGASASTESAPSVAVDVDDDDRSKGRSEADLCSDVQLLVAEINRLKARLVSANARSDKPIDVATALGERPVDDHRACVDEYQQLELKFELFKLKAAPRQHADNAVASKAGAGSELQVRALKERNKALAQQLQDSQEESARRLEQRELAAEAERAKWREAATAAAADHKRQRLLLEQELVKQRERSMALIEEKDHEIATLKATFQMFVPGHASVGPDADSADVMTQLSQLGHVLHAGSASATGGATAAGTHMLHYAHELSRRDVEISALRKAKHGVESDFREAQRQASRVEERLKDRVASLSDEVGRLQRCQSREGANLEYLKNVVLSFLLSRDAGSKQHMANAIAAVLKFSAEELDKVNQSTFSAVGQ